MSFDEHEMKKLKHAVKVLGEADKETQSAMEVRAAIAEAVVRQNFPGITDPEMLAAIGIVIAYVAAELGELPIREAAEAVASVYMSYTLAAARILKLYDPSAPNVKIEKEEAKPTAPLQTGQYL